MRFLGRPDKWIELFYAAGSFVNRATSFHKELQLESWRNQMGPCCHSNCGQTMFMRTECFIICVWGMAVSNTLPSFAARPVATVGPAAISLVVPGELGNPRLAKMGFVDVTASPFSADPTGKTDSTRAIQRAIVFARDHQMVSYFPAGTYSISDTIQCLHGRWDPAIGKLRNTRDLPCILVGDRSGSRRPVIRLADRSAGFGNPERPKYAIRFWSWGTGKTQPKTELQPNINMNQMLIGIDVTIGKENPGAVAVRHRAAQGSSIQDCTIDARGGLTGLEGGAGSGGSHFNVTIIGGRIGVDYRETQPAPTIAGFTLIDQTETAILNASRQSLNVVGCRIETNRAGPVVICEQRSPHHGQMSMVDCSFEFKQPGPNVAIQTNSAVTLHNVYFRDVQTVVQGRSDALLTSQRDGWLTVREFAATLRPLPTGSWTSMPGIQYKAPVYVDGERFDPFDRSIVTYDESAPEDLTNRHIWDRAFPSWQSPQAVNVRKIPYGAKGDGKVDDADAIQRAIEDHETVFLPKGIYAVSRPIELKANTKLLGVGRCFTWLEPLQQTNGPFSDPENPEPILRTANNANSDCVVAFLGIRAKVSSPGAFCLKWQSGRKSIFRAVNIEMPTRWSKPRGMVDPIYQFPVVKISGNGGGRWYNFHQESWHFHGRSYRHLLVDGTTEPLHLYQCNPEHARSGANLEIRDAKGVSIYGVKGEYNEPIIAVRNSDHIRIFGYGGNAAARPGQSLFVVQDTPNFVLTNLVDSPRFAGSGSPDHFAGEGVDPRLWHMVLERTSESSTIRTQPLDRPAMYRRGHPQSN
ncbi:MAG: glycosyl hydrolase family 28-related protein [Pirellulaceae bacterium]